MLQFGVCKALETIGAMALLCENGLDISLGFTANCWSQDVAWSCCSSYGFPYNLEFGEVFDVPPHRASSWRCRNVTGDVIANHIVPSSPVSNVPGDVASLASI